MKMLSFLFFCLLIALGRCEGNVTTLEPTPDLASSTVAPNVTTTTTSAPPTPPKPQATVNEYVLKGNGYNCTVMTFAAEFEVIFANSTNQTTTYVLNNQTAVDASKSSCNANRTVITLVSPDATSFQLSFKNENGSYLVDHVILSVTDSAKAVHTIEQDVTLFKVPDGRSFLCKNDQPVNLGPNKSADSAVAKFSNLQVDAFRTNSTSTGYRAPQECAIDFDNDDVVPFVVGCGLIALVLIVLVAYLIGRKRSRRLHYQSV